MKLLVIGASPGIGLEVVKQALSCGYEVRAFARSATSIGLSSPRLEKRKGNALNVAVILALGVRAGPGMATFFPGQLRLLSTP
jgi:short-subunit dehydrogenase